MTLTITLKTEAIANLDLSPAKAVIEPLLKSGDLVQKEQQINFEIDYAREETDPRELSEVPEVRLYFVRLDACYPWLPLFLDWKSGELARYSAMLVPHQFNRTEGIQYNPEALEIFIMHKIFVLTNWLQQLGIPSKSRVKSLAKTLGYELDDSFFELLDR
jgi:hypothetical protein